MADSAYYGPRALGGGPLLGSKVMRLIYADESGVAPKDPLAVVCAIMAVPDAPWWALERDIDELKRQVPLPYRDGFIFRASDLLGRISKYDVHWPREDRIRVLGELVGLPAKHRICISFGFCENFPMDGLSRSDMSLMAHVLAYAYAVAACDQQIIETGPKEEMALLFVEDSNRARRAIDAIHENLKKPDFAEGLAISGFPLKRIKDSVNFVPKDRSLFLQLADGCASVVRRQLSGAPENEALLTSLLGGQPVPEALIRKDGIAAASSCLYWREV